MNLRHIHYITCLTWWSLNVLQSGTVSALQTWNGAFYLSLCWGWKVREHVQDVEFHLLLFSCTEASAMIRESSARARVLAIANQYRSKASNQDRGSARSFVPLHLLLLRNSRTFGVEKWCGSKSQQGSMRS